MVHLDYNDSNICLEYYSKANQQISTMPIVPLLMLDSHE